MYWFGPILLCTLVLDKFTATFVYVRMGNGTESTYAYYRQCERLQDMLLTANGASIMETQYKYALIDNILGVSNVITPKTPNRREGVEDWAVWMVRVASIPARNSTRRLDCTIMVQEI